MLLERNIRFKIERCLATFPVVVLLGARQSGKTTLARMIKPEWRYFDLEKGTDFDLITRDFDFFFKRYPDSVIIDEAQMSPELFRELRGAVDSDRARKGRFILTGSSSPHLQRNISESLAGRVAVIEVGTLKMNERYQTPLSSFYTILDGVSVGQHLDAFKALPCPLAWEEVQNHFLKGGYPEPAVNEDATFFAEWMANYRQAYLQRDIRRLFPSLNAENYRRFLGMLAELSGTIINRSEIGRSLNASEAAVRDYLDIAEGTFVWRNVTSLERTVSKSVTKMPRGYLRDSGLMHDLLNVRAPDRMMENPRVGAAFEGFVIEEIIQGLQAVETARWQFNYYRTRGGAEVDLVLTTPHGQRIPVEIKFGMSTGRGALRALAAFIEQENCPYGVLVNNADSVQMLTDKIIQIPAGCL